MALQAMNAARPRVILLMTSIALLLMPTLVVANRDTSEYLDGKDLAHYMSVSWWLPFGPNPSSIPEDPFS
jgi:hypothetical protein